MLWMIVPSGISERYIACPTLGNASFPEWIFIPGVKPSGAMIYLFSPSVYSTRQMRLVRFGSYSTVSTVASICLLRLKSMTL